MSWDVEMARVLFVPTAFKIIQAQSWSADALKSMHLGFYELAESRLQMI